jgi:hypothetical protein
MLLVIQPAAATAKIDTSHQVANSIVATQADYVLTAFQAILPQSGCNLGGLAR